MNVNVIDVVLGLLISLSIFSWVLAIYKFLQNHKATQNDRAFSKAFWSFSNRDEARAAVAYDKTELGQISNAGFVVYDAYLSDSYSLRHAGEVNEVLERPLKQKAEEIMLQRERFK